MYKKTKSFVIACEGHGNKTVDYYQYSKKRGKYVRVATKATYQNEYGDYVGWSYSGEKGIISKSKFDSIVKKLKKGKKTNLWNGKKYRISGSAIN